VNQALVSFQLDPSVIGRGGADVDSSQRFDRPLAGFLRCATSLSPSGAKFGLRKNSLGPDRAMIRRVRSRSVTMATPLGGRPPRKAKARRSPRGDQLGQRSWR